MIKRSPLLPIQLEKHLDLKLKRCHSGSPHCIRPRRRVAAVALTLEIPNCKHPLDSPQMWPDDESIPSLNPAAWRACKMTVNAAVNKTFRETSFTHCPSTPDPPSALGLAMPEQGLCQPHAALPAARRWALRVGVTGGDHMAGGEGKRSCLLPAGFLFPSVLPWSHFFALAGAVSHHGSTRRQLAALPPLAGLPAPSR